MWTFSPTLLVIVGTVACWLLLWGRIWGDKQNKTGEKCNCPLTLLIRAGYLTIMGYLGVFLIDGVFKMYLTDLLVYGNIKYILSASILCTGLGIFLIIGAIFIAPTWKTLVSFGVMLAAALYIEITSISNPDLEYTDLLLYPLAITLGVQILLTIGDLVYNALKRKDRTRISLKEFQAILSPPLWDKSSKFKKRVTTRWYLVIYAVFVVELILLFEGMTFFIWL